MLTTPLQAKSCSSLAIAGDDRRVATRRLHTITAAITELHTERSGRLLARLNAFVDGLGRRTLYVALDVHEAHQALRTLTHPGTLVRASGELVTEGARLVLLHAHGLQFLEPEPNEHAQ